MILEKRIPLRYLLTIAKADIFFVTLFSVIVPLTTDLFNIDYDFPFSIPAFLGTAISLVLSFKLAQSYDRWWEARKIWGAIVNDSRSLVVQVKNFCVQRNHPLVARIGSRQIAWCYALARHLRKQDPLEGIGEKISPEEASELKGDMHIPLALLNLHAQDMRSLLEIEAINSYQHIQLDQTLVRLCESMGQAERIKNTVFPKQYRLFLHFFIYIFIATLALSLTDLVFYLEVPLLVAITLPFFLLEKTALLLQDPFENRPNDTPMTTISRAIDTNIRTLLEETPKVVEETGEKSFFIL